MCVSVCSVCTCVCVYVYVCMCSVYRCGCACPAGNVCVCVCALAVLTNFLDTADYPHLPHRIDPLGVCIIFGACQIAVIMLSISSVMFCFVSAISQKHL